MERPRVGWGVLVPDETIAPETEKLLEQMRALPRGQVEALLTRAVERFLTVQMELGEHAIPSGSEMVQCTSAIANMWHDILGRP